MRSIQVVPGENILASQANLERADSLAASWLEAHQMLGTLALGTNATNGQTLTITINGTAIVITFVSVIGAAAGNVLIAGTAALTANNLIGLLQNPQTTSTTQVALSAANQTLTTYLSFLQNGTNFYLSSNNIILSAPWTTIAVATTVTGGTWTSNLLAAIIQAGTAYVGNTVVKYAGGISPTFIDPKLGGTISLGTNPSNTNTLTLTINGTGVVFTFVSVIGVTAGNVLIAGTAALTIANLLALLQAPGVTTANGVALSGGNQTLINYSTYTSPTSTTILSNALNASQGSLTSWTGATTVASGTVTVNANNRIDLITIDNSGVIALVTGTTASSPSPPAYPNNKLVLAEVTCVPNQTGIYDLLNQQTSQGYFSADSRAYLGGTYISSDSQVDAAAAISFSKLNSGAINVPLLPDGNNTRDLGSASFQWRNIYAGTNLIINGVNAAVSKFGGSGADGALSITSGTTTLSFGSAALLVKQYTTVGITSTGVLGFSTPATNGSCFIMRATGAVTITSSTVPAIDLRSMGAAGGATNAGGGGNLCANNGGGGASAASDGETVVSGGAKDAGCGTSGWTPGLNGVDGIGFGRTSAGRGGGYINYFDSGASGVSVNTFGARGLTFGTAWTAVQMSNAIPLTPGSGGGSGGSYTSNTGGAGGIGAGSIYIECAGALNITSTINASGANGSAGGGSSGGGGGGGAGCIIILYGSLTANSGTYTVTGGTGGGSSFRTGGNGGAGLSYVAANQQFP